MGRTRSQWYPVVLPNTWLKLTLMHFLNSYSNSKTFCFLEENILPNSYLDLSSKRSWLGHVWIYLCLSRICLLCLCFIMPFLEGEQTLVRAMWGDGSPNNLHRHLSPAWLDSHSVLLSTWKEEYSVGTPFSVLVLSSSL